MESTQTGLSKQVKKEEDGQKAIADLKPRPFVMFCHLRQGGGGGGLAFPKEAS